MYFEKHYKIKLKLKDLLTKTTMHYIYRKVIPQHAICQLATSIVFRESSYIWSFPNPEIVFTALIVLKDNDIYQLLFAWSVVSFQTQCVPQGSHRKFGQKSGEKGFLLLSKGHILMSNQIGIVWHSLKSFSWHWYANEWIQLKNYATKNAQQVFNHCGGSTCSLIMQS